MKISTKAATFLSSIKTQTYDKKEREMIITYQQKRVFHLSLLMLALCAPYTYIQFHFPMNSFIILTAYYSCLSLCALSLILKRE